MKNKAPLTLMEQLTMILVFALAAAVCLRLFALANTMSVNAADQDQAVMKVQNAAETLKLFQGDFERFVETCGGEQTSTGWKIGYDENWEPVAEKTPTYAVEAIEFDDQIPLLRTATVTANARNGKQLFQINVSWQEACDE